MSYDISFWKVAGDNKAEPKKIYKALCRGKPVASLETLPVAQVLEQLKLTFPTFVATSTIRQIDFPDGSNIEVNWSDHHFRFDGRGEVDAAFDRIFRIMTSHSCTMFDPQTEELLSPGVPSPFVDPQEAEEFRRMLRNAMDAGQEFGETFAEVGPYRWFFYPYQEPQAPHAYAQRERHVVKLWIAPLKCGWNAGFGLGWIDHCLDTATEDYEWLKERWDEFARKNRSASKPPGGNAMPE